MRVRHLWVLGVLMTVTLLQAAPARHLTFEDRVHAQEIVERFHYSYRTGSERPFQLLVTRELLEFRVRDYLAKTAALAEFWGVAIDQQMLDDEVRRMIRETGHPDRLRELLNRLADDPAVIRKCVALPALVDRLTRSFFDFDPVIHSGQRAQASAIREALVTGRQSDLPPDLRRQVIEIHTTEKAQAEPPPVELPPGHGRLLLSEEEFGRRLSGLPDRSGEIGPVEEERTAFVIRSPLLLEPARVRVANYVIPKQTYEDWWRETAPLFDRHVDPDLTYQPTAGTSFSIDNVDPGCVPDDTWVALTEPDARRNHTAVWTGSEMIVWGGQYYDTMGGIYENLSTGGRYDPAADSWAPTSTVGVPEPVRSSTGVWTGAEMIVWGSSSSTPSVGGRYEPILDAWTPTDLANSPQDRVYHAAVWTGSEMIVTGRPLSDTYPAESGRYFVGNPDPDSDGVAGACDCAPLDPGRVTPDEITGVTAEQPAPTILRLNWSEVAEADWYSVTRGSIASLSPGVYGTCLEPGTGSPSVDDASIPPLGEGFTYLVQSEGALCGSSSLGSDSTGTPRANEDPLACP